jgi:hypothetical protein
MRLAVQYLDAYTYEFVRPQVAPDNSGLHQPLPRLRMSPKSRSVYLGYDKYLRVPCSSMHGLLI